MLPLARLRVAASASRVDRVNPVPRNCQEMEARWKFGATVNSELTTFNPRPVRTLRHPVASCHFVSPPPERIRNAEVRGSNPLSSTFLTSPKASVSNGGPSPARQGGGPLVPIWCQEMEAPRYPLDSYPLSPYVPGCSLAGRFRNARAHGVPRPSHRSIRCRGDATSLSGAPGDRGIRVAGYLSNLREVEGGRSL